MKTKVDRFHDRFVTPATPEEYEDLRARGWQWSPYHVAFRVPPPPNPFDDLKAWEAQFDLFGLDR